MTIAVDWDVKHQNKQKNNLIICIFIQKAKSMQPRDFEEEVSRSAERVNRKQRRLDALDRLHSAESTPQTSPRMSRILVQDTQPRSPVSSLLEYSKTSLQRPLKMYKTMVA